MEELPRDWELMDLSPVRAGRIILTTLKEVVIDSSLSSTVGSEHHAKRTSHIATGVARKRTLTAKRC